MIETVRVDTCASCGAVSPFSTDDACECEVTDRNVAWDVTDSAIARDGIRLKLRDAEGGKPHREMSAEPSYYRDGEKWVHRVVNADRREDRYDEVVTDPDTGEVIYECHEPLSKHLGHGDARSPHCPETL